MPKFYLSLLLEQLSGVTRQSAPNPVNFKPEYANQMEGGMKFVPRMAMPMPLRQFLANVTLKF